MVKGHCHSNQFCGVKRQKVCIKRLHCSCWHFKTVGKIATYTHTETLDVVSTSAKNFVNFGPVTSEILWLTCRSG